MAIYYPFCVCAIGIRFDSSFTVFKNARKKPQPGSIEELFTDDAAKPWVRKDDKSLEPLVTDAEGDLSWFVNLVPRSASVKLDGYRKAGHFSLELDWINLAFDPQLVKAGQVRIFFGCADPSDFAATVQSSLAGKTQRILRTHDDAGAPIPELLALWGSIDVIKVHYENGGARMNLEGRDIRGLLLDSPISPDKVKNLKLDQPINKVVEDILKTHPLANKDMIVVQPVDWENYGVEPGTQGPPRPIPSPVTKDGVTRVRSGVKGNKPGHEPAAANNKLTYWDLCVQFCYLVGAVPYFAGRELRIRPVSAIESLKGVADPQTGAITFDPRLKTPFANNRTRKIGGEEYAIRKLVLGRNLSKLSMERKLVGQMRPKGIEVSSLDTRKHKLLRVIWPKKLKQKVGGKKGEGTTANPSGGAGATEVHRVTIPGITDEAQLLEIAKAIFESTAHHEIEGNFEMMDLASLGPTADPTNPASWANADADMLRARPGDAVQLKTDTAQLNTRQRNQDQFVSTVTQNEGLSFDEAVSAVAKRLEAHTPDGQVVGDQNFARAIVATGRNAVVELQSYYRIHAMEFHWQMQGDSGSCRVSGQFHNYIEAVYGEPGAKASKKQPLTRISVNSTQDPTTESLLDGDLKDPLDLVPFK